MSQVSLARARSLRPDAGLAGLGLLSGIASAVWGMGALNLDALRPVATVFGLAPELLPVGFFYGAALAIGLWLYTGRALALPVALVTAMYAWSAAVNVAIRLQRNAGDDGHLLAASVGAGAVGAALTQADCSLVAPSLRRPLRIVATALLGAVAGLLFYTGERNITTDRLLYLVWQPLVAFSIGAALSRSDQAP